MTTAAERVRCCLEEALPRWFGLGSRPTSLSGPHLHEWSFQFTLAAETPQGTRRLVVKIPRWEEAPTLAAALEAGPQDGTRREHAALEALATAVAASGDSGLAAVAPVAYLSEVNAVVTERLDAVPLGARLGPLPGAERRHQEVLRRAGRLLRLYHEQAAGAHTGRLDGVGLAAEVAALAERLAASGVRLGDVAVLARRAGERDGMPVPAGACHGDYNLANVLVTSEGRVAVLDPNLVPGPLVEDVAKLLVALRMRRARALSLGRLGGRSLEAAEAAFLEGYGPVDPGLLALFRGVGALRRGAEMAGRLARLPGPVRRAAAAALRRYLSAELSPPGASARRRRP